MDFVFFSPVTQSSRGQNRVTKAETRAGSDSTFGSLKPCSARTPTVALAPPTSPFNDEERGFRVQDERRDCGLPGDLQRLDDRHLRINGRALLLMQANVRSSRQRRPHRPRSNRSSLELGGPCLPRAAGQAADCNRARTERDGAQNDSRCTRGR